MASTPTSDSSARVSPRASSESMAPAWLDAVLRAGGMALWEWRPATDDLQWFDGSDELFNGNSAPCPTTLAAFLSHVHGDDQTRLSEALRRAAETAQRYAVDFRLIRAAGEERWFASRGQGDTGRDGSCRVVGAIYDITDEKQARHELEQSRLSLKQAVMERTMELDAYAARVAHSQQQARVLGETLPYGVWICEADGRIKYLSDQFLRLIGMSLSEAQAAAVYAWASPEQRDLLRQRWRQCLESGSEWDQQYAIRDQSGGWRTVLSRGRPVRDEAGTIQSWVGINLDVTDRTEAEQLLAQREAQLAHFDRMGLMGELASGLAHELNQPLAAISSYAEGCLQRLNREAAGEAESLRFGLERITHQADRAGRIIRHLREFARVGEPMYSRVAIPDLIHEALELIKGDLQAAQIPLVLSCDDRLPDVRAGHIEIQQVLLNLIRNATDAMHAIPVNQRQLTIRAQLAGLGHVQISVEDAGPGASEEALKHMFDPFFTTKDDGMGVGLNLCETLVQHHGGRLWAEHNNAGGLTMQLKLPIHPPGLNNDNGAE